VVFTTKYYILVIDRAVYFNQAVCIRWSCPVQWFTVCYLANRKGS